MSDQEQSAASEKGALSQRIKQRIEARLATINALYSNEVSDEQKSASELALDILALYDSGEYEDQIMPDVRYLKKLLAGVVEHKEIIDQKIVAHLQTGWKLERLGAVMLSLLRSATYELMAYEHLSIKVIINEYVEIAHGFFEEKEVSFVNGVLDKIAKEVRV